MAGSATGCMLSARVLRRDAVKIRDEGSCGTRRCISPSAFFPTARRRYSVSGLEWLRRVPRSDQRRTSRDDRSDLHRRPAPQLDELRVVEGSQTDRASAPRRYRAEGLAALKAFEQGHWGKRHPAIAQSWRRHWDQGILLFAFPEGVHRIIYTTNAIEALNSKLRRAVRTRSHVPGDDAAMKLLYLVLNTAAQRKRPPRTEFLIVPPVPTTGDGETDHQGMAGRLQSCFITPICLCC